MKLITHHCKACGWLPLLDEGAIMHFKGSLHCRGILFKSTLLSIPWLEERALYNFCMAAMSEDWT